MSDHMNELLERLRKTADETRLENKNKSHNLHHGLCDEITINTPRRYNYEAMCSQRS